MHDCHIEAQVNALVAASLLPADRADEATNALIAHWQEYGIANVWKPDDVRSCTGKELDDQQCMEILENVFSEFDANYGISWTQIETAAHFVIG